MAHLARELKPTLSVAELRGHEGEAAHTYFSVFDHLIVGDKENFFFRNRSRRPPLDNVNASMPSGPAGPPKRETSPVGVPEPDVTFMVTLTGWPCVRVIGLVGGVVESANMVLVEWKLAFVQFFTRFAAFTVPSPVARS